MGATIFSGSKVKTLKDELQLLNGASFLNLSSDPTTNATAANAGSIGIYNGRHYKKLDSGSTTNWVEMQSNGGINYIQNWKSIYTGYNDGASAVPVDGTGGTLSNLSLSINTTNALDGVSDLKIAKSAANAQGEGVSFDFTVPTRAIGNMHTLKFNYYFSAAIEEGTFTVWLYKKDSTAQQYQLVPYQIPVATVPSKFVAQVQLNYDATLSNVDDWRLEIHCAGTNTTATNLYISDIEFGPTEFVYGSPDVYLGELTTTGSFSNTTYKGVYWRKGDRLKGLVYCSLTGTPAAATFTITLPNNLNMDLDSDFGSAGRSSLGDAIIYDAGNATYVGHVSFATTTSVRIETTSGTVSNSVPFSFGNGDSIHLSFEVPIKGWSSNVQMSESADTRACLSRFYNASSFGITGGSVATPTTNWQVSFDTHGMFNSNGSSTIKVPGYYTLTAFATMASVPANTILAYRIDGGGWAFFGTGVNAGGSDRVGGSSQFGFLRAGQNVQVGIYCAANSTCNYLDYSLTRVTGPSQIAASEKIACIARKTSGAHTSNNNDQVISGLTVDKDTHGCFNSTNGRWTAPRAGDYIVHGAVAFELNSTGGRSVSIWKNGSKIFTGATLYASSVHACLSFSCLVSLNAGDYIEITAWQNSGGDLNYMSLNGLQTTLCINSI